MAKRVRRQKVGQPPKNGGAPPMLQAYDAVQQAEKFRLAGKLDRAKSLCAGALKLFPDYVAALHTMGLILADQTQYDRALDHLHRATMLNPDDRKVLIALSGVYLRLGSHQMAARTLEQTLETEPRDANILVTLGEIYREQKEYELAKRAYEEALDAEPQLRVAELGLVRNLLDIGALSEAATIVERHIREGSRALFLLYTLGQLPRSMVSLDATTLLEEAEPGDGKMSPDEFAAQLAFAKAAAFDKAGKHESTWEQLQKARRFKRGENNKSYQVHRQRHEPLLEIARSAPDNVAFTGNDFPDHPISLFIVGPSRSGKTSLERLVGALPGVKRGYENPIVENAVRRSFQTAGFPTRSFLTELPPGLGDRFREYYLGELSERAGPASVLTNTLPTRTEDAIRAAAEIPNARFVFIKRDLNDLTIRIFMRNYASGNFHASNLANIRDYLTWCHAMIDAMAEKLPQISRVISYEDMAADPVAAQALVADLCGLDPTGASVPQIGDDRGCGKPYVQQIEAAVAAA